MPRPNLPSLLYSLIRQNPLPMVYLFGFLLVTVVVPGFAAVRLLRTPVSSVTALPYAFCTGFAVWAVLTPFFYLLHVPWSVAIGIHLLTAGGLWVCFVVKRHYRDLPRLEKNEWLAWVFVLGLVAVMGWKGGFQDGDAWYHIAQARHYLDSETLYSANAYYKGQPAGTVYDYNAWHLFIAYIARATRLDLAVIWVDLLPVVLLASFLTSYGLVRAFRPTTAAAAAWAGVLLLAFATGDEGLTLWLTAVYPYGIGMMLLNPLIVLTLLRQTDAPATYRAAIQLGILTFSAAGAHLFTYVYLMIHVALIFGVLFIHAYRMSDRTRRWKTLMRQAAVCLAAGLFHLIAAYILTRTDRPAEPFPGTPLRLISYGEQWYAFPLDQLYPLTLITLAVAFIYMAARPSFFRDTRIFFFVTPLFFQPILLYNPLLTPLFAKALHINLVGRFKNVIWTLALLPLFIADITEREPVRALAGRRWRWLHTRRRRILRPGAVILVTAALAGGYLQRDRFGALMHRIIAYNRYAGPLFQTHFFSDIDTVVPARSVILSDPYTSYHIPAFADQYIHAANIRSIPPSLDIRDRYRAYLRMVSPFPSFAERRDLIRRYGIDYIVVNDVILPLAGLRDPVTQPPPLLTGWAYPDWNTVSLNARLYDVRDLPSDAPSTVATVPFAGVMETPGWSISTFPASTVRAESLHFSHAGYIILDVHLREAHEGDMFSFAFSSSYGFHQVLQIASYAHTDGVWQETGLQTHINKVQAGDRYTFAMPVRSKRLGVFISGSVFLDLTLSDFRVGHKTP